MSCSPFISTTWKVPEPEKEAASPKKIQMRFAKQFNHGLHGEAWRACPALVESPEELRAIDGYKKGLAPFG